MLFVPIPQYGSYRIGEIWKAHRRGNVLDLGPYVGE